MLKRTCNRCWTNPPLFQLASKQFGRLGYSYIADPSSERWGLFRLSGNPHDESAGSVCPRNFRRVVGLDRGLPCLDSVSAKGGGVSWELRPSIYESRTRFSPDGKSCSSGAATFAFRQRSKWQPSLTMKPWTKDKVTKRNAIGSVSYPYVSARLECFPSLTQSRPRAAAQGGAGSSILDAAPWEMM
jgi:hypothetical protein